MPKLRQYQRHNLMLERLQNGELLSIAALAQEWKVTTKTLQRDFKKLMEGNYGVVRAEDGKCFQIKKKSYTPKSTETAIRMLESLSLDIGGEFYTKARVALHTLQSCLESPFYTRIDVESISDKLDLVEDLEYAIGKQKMLTFRYKRWYRPDEIKTYRHVHPYKIIIFNGFWYLLARYKTYTIKFYLKEIRELQIEGGVFEKEKRVLERLERSLGIHFNTEDEPFEVTLLLESDAIVYFERKPVKGQFLKKNSDGTAELTVTVTSKKEIFPLMKQWLPQMRIIEPHCLQEEFERELQAYLSTC